MDNNGEISRGTDPKRDIEGLLGRLTFPDVRNDTTNGTGGLVDTTVDEEAFTEGGHDPLNWKTWPVE